MLCFPSSSLMALSLLSLNCNGIRDQFKRTGLVQWLGSLHVIVDVVCLQETHCVSQTECTLWFSSSGFLSCLSPGSNHSCGCVLLYHPSLSLVDSWIDTSVATSSVSFPSTTSLFVSTVFMPLTVTLNVTSSLKIYLIKLILQSPPYLWVTSTLSLIGSRIVVGLTLLTTAVRVLFALLPFSTPVVSLTSGDTCTPTLLVLPGQDLMAPLPLESTFVVCCMCGYLLFLLALSLPALFLTIVLSCCPYPFLMSSPLALVCGN